MVDIRIILDTDGDGICDNLETDRIPALELLTQIVDIPIKTPTLVRNEE